MVERGSGRERVEVVEEWLGIVWCLLPYLVAISRLSRESP